VEILKSAYEIMISHDGEMYRLRVKRNGRLISNKYIPRAAALITPECLGNAITFTLAWLSFRVLFGRRHVLILQLPA
jgi:hypothetical protein